VSQTDKLVAFNLAPPAVIDPNCWELRPCFSP
jgi:hypothetical protein